MFKIFLFFFIFLLFTNEIRLVESSKDIHYLQDELEISFKLDQPRQLIYPDEQHQKLLINQTVLNALNSLQNEQSILGVVGTFHSGKSFLLNQLMGTTDTFTVGPTVMPQTLGIWIWSATITVGSTKHHLLLLDTEGFYSSNVSETYDAKIFAITTLLSSHLIYNSVKIIDQSALEYLELLSRRTQLFSLKTQIKSDSPLLKILEFPSLTWVVQDFFQDIGDQTATEWLHKLLKAHSRDQPDFHLSISKIFPSIQCHTLFIPSGDRNTLRYLNKAQINELNPIYLKEMELLKKSIFDSLKPKLKGPAIGSLLKLLVQVANGNNFPTVPSIWIGFIKQQQTNALEDSINSFKEKMEVLFKEEPPLSEYQYQQLQQSSLSFINDLYKQLLFGLEEAYKPGLLQLDKTLKELNEHYGKENKYRIKGYCSSLASSSLLIFQDKLESIQIPESNKILLESIKSLKDLIMNDFKNQSKKYHSTEILVNFLNNLNNDIDRLSSQKILKNKNEIESLLSKSTTASTQKYKELMKDGQKYPLIFKELESLNKENRDRVKKWFLSKVQIAEDEVYFTAFQSNLDKLLNELYDEFKKYNEEMIMEKCKTESMSLKYEFKRGVSQILLPVEEEYLEFRTDELKTKVLESYQVNLEIYNNTNAFKEELLNFKQFLDKQIEMKQKENVEQMKLIVMESLNKVKMVMKSRLSSFWFQYSFKTETKNEATKLLIHKIESAKLREKVILQFIETDLRDEEMSFYKRRSSIATTSSTTNREIIKTRRSSSVQYNTRLNILEEEDIIINNINNNRNNEKDAIILIGDYESDSDDSDDFEDRLNNPKELIVLEEHNGSICSIAKKNKSYRDSVEFDIERLPMTHSIKDISGIIKPSNLLTDVQHELLVLFYRFLKLNIPQTHKRKQGSQHLSKHKNRRYFFGMELTEWILLARMEEVSRREAIEIAESILILQLFIKVQGAHARARHAYSVTGTHQRLFFKDDKTRYFFISEDIIENKQRYTEFLWRRYTKHKYIPDTTRLINKIFKQSNIDNQHLNNNNLNQQSSSSSSFNLQQQQQQQQQNQPKSKRKRIFANRLSDKFFHYSENPECHVKVYVPSPRERRQMKTDLGTFQVEVPSSTGYRGDITITSGISPLEIINNAYKSIELDISSFKWTKYIPLVIFSIALSTSALSLQWRSMNSLFSTPALIYKIIVCFSAAILILATVVEIVSIVIHTDKILNDLKNTIQVTFWCMISMCLFQIADVAHEFSTWLSKALFWASFAIQCGSSVLFIIQIIISHHAKIPLRMTPSFLFYGTGIILGSYTAQTCGYHGFAWVLWSIGTIYCTLAQIAILVSYVIFGLLPAEHIPSQTILVAFPSLSFTSLVYIHGGLSIPIRLMYGVIYLNLTITITLWILMKRRFRSARTPLFHLGWWAFCFPFLSFSTASLNYYKYTRFLSCKIIGIALVSISDFIYALVAFLTIYHLIRHNLFISSRYKIPVY